MSLHSQKASRGRISPLPSYSSAVEEKSHLNGKSHSSFFTMIYLPIPGVPDRQLRIPLPIPFRLYRSTVSRYGRKRGCGLLVVGLLAALWMVFALSKRFGSAAKSWPPPFQKDTTLVFQREDLRKIWEWEIESGHYPSSRKSEYIRSFTPHPICPPKPFYEFTLNITLISRINERLFTDDPSSSNIINLL